MKRVLSLILSAVCVLSTVNLTYAEDITPIDAELSDKYIEYINMDKEEQKNNLVPFPVKLPKLKKPKLLKAGNYPDRFDIRDTDYSVTIRNQMQTGICWAFSSLTSLSIYFKKNTGNEYMYSARHTENAAAQNPKDLKNPMAFNRVVNDGGNEMMISAYFMRGSGPVNEECLPFVNNKIAEPTSKIYQPISAQVLDFESTDDEPHTYEEVVAGIKDTVMEYGSVCVGMNMQETTSYDTSNYSYYHPNSTTTNHAVLIVGWDDNYPKENFKTTPLQDGAWIIQNSWGENWGDGGYFYMSYDENEIYSDMSAIRRATETVDYDNIYSYDPLGWCSWSGYNGINTVYAANVFKKQPGTEKLTQVSFGNVGATSYEIYVNPTGGTTQISRMKLVASGAIDFAGYKTVELNNPIDLTGTQFTVVVKYINDYIDSIYYPMERNIGNVYSAAVYDGKSYISQRGSTWSLNSNGDCSIKAFTTDVTPKTKVDFSKSNENSLVYMTSSNGEKMSPKADGTYSLTDDDYNFEVALFGNDSVTGKFKINNEEKRTLYAYNTPGSMNDAIETLDDEMTNFHQSGTIADVNDAIGRAVGSTYRIDENGNYTITPPDDECNGEINGTVTLYDTFNNTNDSITYNNQTIFKAKLVKFGALAKIIGNSSINGTLYVAEYDDGVLVAITKYKVDLEEGDEASLSLDNNEKLFLWENGEMYPYAKAVD